MSNDYETVIATPYYLPDQLCDAVIEKAKIRKHLDVFEAEIEFGK